MKCPYCGEEVNNVIMDSSNNTYCSKCYSSLLEILEIPALASNLNFTNENMLLYVNSEKLINNEAIDNSEAVSLCYKSLQLGNPYAIINIGYYLEMGIIKCESKMALRMALNCYLSVAVYEEKIRRIVERIFNISIKLSSGFSANNNIKHVGNALYNSLCILVNNDFTGIMKHEDEALLTNTLKQALESYDVEELRNADLSSLNYDATTDESVYESAIDQFEAFISSASKRNSEALFAIQKTSVSMIKKLIRASTLKIKVFDQYKLMIWHNGQMIPLLNSFDFDQKMSDFDDAQNLIIVIYNTKIRKKRFSFLNKRGTEIETKKALVSFEPKKLVSFVEEGVDLEAHIGNYYYDDMYISKVREIRKEDTQMFIDKFIE